MSATGQDKIIPLYFPAPYQESADRGTLILTDGTVAAVRVANIDDAPALEQFFRRMSEESREHRFFSSSAPPIELVRFLCDSSNPQSKLTLLVTRTTHSEEVVLGAGSYVAEDSRRAEVAMAVDDRFQGKGIGTQLLERLALLATRAGLSRFWAMTTLDNRGMIEVFRHSGFRMTEEVGQGNLELDFSVMPTESSVELSEIRDRTVTAASLRWFFKPSSVAVIGVSRDSSGIGHRIFKALVANGFEGPVYPVNPHAAFVASTRAYASVLGLPEAVDLAIVTVPRDLVLPVIDECAQHGIKSIVVITAGFAEVDQDGKILQNRLRERVRGYGMRMIGPNCMGLVNTDERIRLAGSFSPVYPPAGRISMSSQSGALGLAILELATRRGLGIANFVSVGNKADVSSNDLLQYWELDEGTRVILLYLESFGNPRRFARIARRVSRSKPIIAVKAGRSSAGKRAAGSHTAALAANEVAVDALFHQTGVIRVETLDEMFDVATLLDSQPLPKGRRVAIITNAGGPGILCTDACEARGLVVEELPTALKAELRQFLPASASVANPIDLIASATPPDYSQTIELLLGSADVDALVIIYIPVDRTNSGDVIQAIKDGVKAGRSRGGREKPVTVCIMSEIGEHNLKTDDETLPAYHLPETAAVVLAKAARYSEWRDQPAALVPGFLDVDADAGRQIVSRAIQSRGAGWLSTEEAQDLLAAFGIAQVRQRLSRTAHEALAFANEFGFPVVAKLASPKVLHKSDTGAVRLNLRNEIELQNAFDELQQPDMEGILIQPMMTGGLELMVGVTEDPAFGPIIAFGLGGIHVEILGDITFRVTPLTDRDSEEMIRGFRGYPLLQGYRGRPAADIPSIRELLLRVSRMVEDIPEIRDLDLNPVFAFKPGDGYMAADVRVRVAPIIPGK